MGGATVDNDNNPIDTINTNLMAEEKGSTSTSSEDHCSSDARPVGNGEDQGARCVYSTYKQPTVYGYSARVCFVVAWDHGGHHG